MEKNKKMATERDARDCGDLQRFFRFYALLVTHFSLRLWLVRRRGGPSKKTLFLLLGRLLELFLLYFCFFFDLLLSWHRRSKIRKWRRSKMLRHRDL